LLAIVLLGGAGSVFEYPVKYDRVDDAKEESNVDLPREDKDEVSDSPDGCSGITSWPKEVDEGDLEWLFLACF
jgi:hypothetical protein